MDGAEGRKCIIEPEASAQEELGVAIQALHNRCGVYTKTALVETVLDAVRWTEGADLKGAQLLEPAAGDGAFVAAAARRLLRSLSGRRKRDPAAIRDSITAYELHAGEAEKARERVVAVFQSEGWSAGHARPLADHWVRTGDFLLEERRTTFTHAVGNPPYCRWSKIPPALRRAYEAALPAAVCKGDLFLPFLDRAIGALRLGGRLGFVCSDRWRYMGFAEQFRRSRLREVTVLKDEALDTSAAFERDVDAYSTMLVLERTPRRPDLQLVAGDASTLKEAGYTVRVGPALGCTPAFVLGPDEHDVEQELLRPWVDGKDVLEGSVRAPSRRVVIMHGEDGKLIDLERHPRLKARLERYREPLRSRSVASTGAWFRPIDRVLAADWMVPKLLVPELARVPRVALDTTGAIPSHGVYAVLAPEPQLRRLYHEWADGGLARALEGRAPRVKGGYVRCYKRFLEALPAPLAPG